MQPPYLEDKKWPISREPDEKTVSDGTGELSEDEIIEHLLSDSEMLQDCLMDNLLTALCNKDLEQIKDALISLIQSIKLEEDENAAKQIG